MRNRVAPNRAVALSIAILASLVAPGAFVASFVLAAILVSVPYLTLPGEARAQSVECDRYAAQTGSDSNSGTYSAPYKTAEKLVRSLSAGQTGCLRGGTYTEGDNRVTVSKGGTSDTNRIVVQNYPGEKATIRAQVKVNLRASFVTFRSSGGLWNLVLDGTGGPVTQKRSNRGRYNTDGSPLIQANNTEWIGLDITKRNRELSSSELYRTGVCVHIGEAVSGTRIEGSKIHGCGVMHDQEDDSYIPNYFGPGEDLDNRASGSPDNHGMYVSNTSGTTYIRDNLIYDNGERGVQLYPDAHGVLIEDNVIDGNGEGLVYNGRSSNNTVKRNIFSFANYDWNAYDAKALGGTGNKFENNCAWQRDGTSGLRLSAKITVSGTVVANPLYRDRANGDYTLAPDSRCLGKGPDYIQP
jgi:parallel beta-helix repeat protein